MFIAGLDRTGKTAMRLAIQSLMSIAISRRAELWTYHFGRHGSLVEETDARRAVAAVLRDPNVAALVDDAGALLVELLAGPRTYARLFALIGRQHARRRGVSRWGDQTALLERRAPDILDALDGARIVHMIRDPRDRYAAARRAGGIGRGGVGGASEEWIESVALADRHSRHWPTRYRTVRYEDFVTSPTATMRRVMELLGDEEPIRAGSVGVSPDLVAGIGMRERLSRRTLAIIESRCGQMMTRHGYDLMTPALSVAERLGLALVDRPVSATTAFAHRLRSAAARRQPARTSISR